MLAWSISGSSVVHEPVLRRISFGNECAPGLGLFQDGA